MAFYGYRAALGRFGIVGEAIVGDYGFDEPWSQQDWTKNSWNPDYRPIASSVITTARSRYKELQDAATAGSQQAKAILAQGYIAQIQDYATGIDQMTRGGYYGQGEMQAGNRIDAFNAINAAMQRLANEKVPDVDAELDAIDAQKEAAAAQVQAAADVKAAALAKAKARAADTAAKLKQTQDAAAEAKAAIADAERAKAIAQASVVAHQKAQAVAVQKKAAVAGKTPYLIGGLVVATAAAIFLARKSGQ